MVKNKMILALLILTVLILPYIAITYGYVINKQHHFSKISMKDKDVKIGTLYDFNPIIYPQNTSELKYNGNRGNKKMIHKLHNNRFERNDQIIPTCSLYLSNEERITLLMILDVKKENCQMPKWISY